MTPRWRGSCRRALRLRGYGPRPGWRDRASDVRHRTSRPTDRSCASCRSRAASTIWVLRAMRAEKSVGSASASSSALVCSDWVPPCVAAMASTQVRATLLNTSCAASDQPEVWQWVRSDSERGVLRIKLLHQLRPQHARGAKLRHFHEKIHADAEEERQPRREAVDVEEAARPARTYSTPSASV